MKQSRREQLHANARMEIKEVAMGQMLENGSAAISLGAIAREMGVTTASLYHYFTNRDSLVSALIVDAITSLIESLQVARDSLPPEDRIGRLQRVAIAWHQWSVANAQQYLLIAHHQKMGYHVDPASIDPEVDALLEIVLNLVEGAVQAGDIDIDSAQSGGRMPIDEEAKLRTLLPSGDAYEPRVIYLAVNLWSFLHGLNILDETLRYTHLKEEWIDHAVKQEIDRFLRSMEGRE